MKIVFWNKKGGVGKTVLAYNVARDLGYFLQSNDDSIIEIAYKGKAKKTKDLKIFDNCVYDLGGFVDAHANTVIKNADLIVIPTIHDLNAILRTRDTIKDVKHINPNANIVLVANNLQRDHKDDDFTEIKQAFKGFEDIFPIPSSKIFSSAMKNSTSVKAMVDNSKMDAWRYRNAYSAYNKLLKFIIKKGK